MGRHLRDMCSAAELEILFRGEGAVRTINDSFFIYIYIYIYHIIFASHSICIYTHLALIT
jgi:hypothetical protein